MKIVFPSTVDPGNPEIGSVLTLCGQGKAEGSFTGTVPVALRLSNSLTITTEKAVSVSSSTKVNRRGVRSGVVKVTMPYNAIMPDGNGGYTSDPSRSGAEISVHLVVALPSNMCTDIKGSDSTIQRNAQLQAAVASFLLGSLLQGLITTPVLAEGSHGSSYRLASPTAPIADPSCDVVAEAAIDDSPRLYGVGGGFEVRGAGYMANGQIRWGNDINQGADLPKGVRSVINRIARNLPAIDGCEDVEAVAWKLDNLEL